MMMMRTRLFQSGMIVLSFAGVLEAQNCSVLDAIPIPIPQGAVYSNFGDLNADGVLDLLVTNAGANRVDVLLGTGSGGFAAPLGFPVGASPREVEVGDWNGDGKLDAATANASAGNVSILLGDGLGGFTSITNVSTGIGPESLEFADVDGDSDVDLVVANSGSVYVSVHRNDGAANFAAPNAYFAGPSPRSLSKGDLNGDGYVDFVVVNALYDFVSPLFGNAFGGFTSPGPIPVLNDPRAVEVGDIDGDGILDLVVAGIGIARYQGLGDGSFYDAINISSNLVVERLALGDLNGDARQDILATHTSVLGNSFAHVYFNDSASTFLDFVGVALDAYPDALLCRDVDSDGFAEFVVTSHEADHLTEFAPTGSSGFSAPIPSIANANQKSLAVADIDLDGTLDACVANWQAHGFGVFLGTGDGQLQYSGSHPTPLNAVGLIVSDLDLDGRADVVARNWSSSTITVHLATGPNQFDGGQIFAAGSEVESLVDGDVNGDGQIDLVTANPMTDDVSILLGTGTGSFAPAVNFPLQASSTGPKRVRIGEITGDSVPDLIVALPSLDAFAVLAGTGSGSFSTPTLVAVGGSSPGDLALIDVDENGLLDVVSANFLSESLSTVLRTSATTFAAPVTYPVGRHPTAIVAQDFDDDGDLDLITSTTSSRSISFLENTAPGGLGFSVSFDVGGEPSSLAAGDFDGDRDLDIACLVHPHSNVTVLRNECSGPILPYGQGCAGSGGFVPSLALSGQPTPGSLLNFSLEDGLGGATALLFFGIHPAAVPLPGSCSLLVSPVLPVIVALPLLGSGPGNGSFQTFGSIPLGTPPMGFTMQSFVIDPGANAGYCASNGLEVHTH